MCCDEYLLLLQPLGNVSVFAPPVTGFQSEEPWSWGELTPAPNRILTLPLNFPCATLTDDFWLSGPVLWKIRRHEKSLSFLLPFSECRFLEINPLCCHKGPHYLSRQHLQADVCSNPLYLHCFCHLPNMRKVQQTICYSWRPTECFCVAP